MNFLPAAITETLGRVQFNSDAPPLRGLPEDEAEYEEGDMDESPDGNQPQGHVRILLWYNNQSHQIFWQGWNTQTGPMVADVEQSRRSRQIEHESEMPDAELKEAMAPMSSSATGLSLAGPRPKAKSTGGRNGTKVISCKQV